MQGFSSICLLGNLTRDPELRYSQAGKAWTKFCVAVNRKFKEKETVSFIECVAFNRVAEIISQRLQKGSPIFVRGPLEQAKWTNQDGETRTKFQVIVQEFNFIPDPKTFGDYHLNNRPQDQSSYEEDIFDPEDEIPF